MDDPSAFFNVNALSRKFGIVPALENISFQVNPGDVIGMVGQRGSGKSTLFRILSGAYQPSGGEIYVDGKRVRLRSVPYTKSLGIEAVHQNPELAENLNMVQNVFLGREICAIPWLKMWPNEGAMTQITRSLFEEFGLPSTLIYQRPANLSNEQRQVVALARALCRPCRLLLLDDPFAGLSFDRQQKLLQRIQELSARGVAVIISSDDLKHIFSVTNRIMVLYQGRMTALRETAETTPREIVELIVGSNRQDQVTPVIWAFENYHAAQQQAEELRRAELVLRESLEAQGSLNRHLFDRLHDQVQALDRLNLALQDANRRLMTEREAERKALARDLHDQIIQDLLSYNYQLEDIEGLAANDEQRTELAEVRSGIRNVISSLRQLCSDLRPPTIDSHGLPAAIRSLSHQWSKQSGIQVELDVNPELGRLPEHIELSVFRIIQEGLSNVRKHANASQVKLSLLRTSTSSLLMQLSDNGQGMPGPVNLATLSEEKHFGLVGISERVSLLGGSMQVNSPTDGGLEILIEIPNPSPFTH